MCSKAIYQIIYAKHQIMTRSQLEKINSDKLAQSFLLLQDELLRIQTKQYSRQECIEIQGIPQKQK